MATTEVLQDTDEYDRRLQGLMQECLPSILVEIVEQRPPDPIAFIANALYKYKNNQESHVTERKANILQSLTMPVSRTENSEKEHFVKTDLKYAIVQSSDILDEPFHDIDVYTEEIRNVKVHDSFLRLLRYMGDLFDDEDLV